MPAQSNLAQLPVAQIGFGAMRITGPGVRGPPSDQGEAIALLRRAVEKGVTFIDTADSYGPGISEALIAEALHPYPAGLVVATKGGLVRPGANRWVTDCRPEHLHHACANKSTFCSISWKTDPAAQHWSCRRRFTAMRQVNCGSYKTWESSSLPVRLSGALWKASLIRTGIIRSPFGGRCRPTAHCLESPRRRTAMIAACGC